VLFNQIVINLLGKTGFSFVAGLPATGRSEDEDKSAKHYKNEMMDFSCYNTPCSQMFFGYTGRPLHVYGYTINTKYDHIRYLLKPNFIHGSCASSSSELFFGPKQPGNDNLKSFPPEIRFIATSSWSTKCPHLKNNSLQSLMQNLVTVLFAEHGGKV